MTHRIRTASGSIYEIDFPHRCFRRLAGAGPMPHRLPDDMWIRFEKFILADNRMWFCRLPVVDCTFNLITSRVVENDRNAVMTQQEWW